MSGPRLLDLHDKSGPVSCAYCRQEEPTVWLLQNNHWSGSAWQQQHPGMCIALDLTRNHVWYALRWHPDDLEMLRGYLDRAWELWQHHPDPDPVLQHARDRIALLQRPAPEHTEVRESEAVSLW